MDKQNYDEPVVLTSKLNKNYEVKVFEGNHNDNQYEFQCLQSGEN